MKKAKTNFWLNLLVQILTAIMAALGGTSLVAAALYVMPVM